MKPKRVKDALAELGALATSPGTNIIKLPNISASVPQLKTWLLDCEAHGYNIPNFPEEPQDKARKTKSRKKNTLKS
jgi:isocitrate dehydrogenase